MKQTSQKLITKRDGTQVVYNPELAANAMAKAFCSVYDETENVLKEGFQNVVIRCLKQIDAIKDLEVEVVQDVIENALMKSKFKAVAKSFIEYRHDRNVKREQGSQLHKDINGIIDQTNIGILNENANKDSRIIPTQRDLLAGIIAKHFAKQNILPKYITDAHESGKLHYHDLDYSPFFPMTNCCLVDLKEMFKGFKMGNAEIETPKSIATACAVTAQIIAQVSSHQYGGTSLNRLDEVLAPFVKASYLKHVEVAKEWNVPDVIGFAEARTEKECHDAFQSLEYEVNTLHTANGQTPFVTIGFGLGTSPEAKLIQKCILQIRIAGLGKSKKTAIFPKLVYGIKNGHNRSEGDEFYDVKQLALECSSKRMYPDVIGYEKMVEVTGSFKTPMGCRSFLDLYLENGEEVHDGRNNLGAVSINLPRIAIEADGDFDLFDEILAERLELCYDALMTRIDRFKGVKASVAPILYCEGAFGVRLKPDDNISELFKNGRSSISLGYIGIHETVKSLTGLNPIDSKDAQELGILIVKKLSDACKRWKEKTGYGFSLYSTPSENLCDRFCRLDVEEFGIVEGINDKGYYTNSFHLDVNQECNPYDKIDFEAPYPELASGGFICYTEFPNMQNNLKALENVWDYATSKVPYYATNTPIDECYECGFSGEFKCTSKGFVCPSCGNHNSETVSVIRRVCGYLGSPDARPFNEGKQEEVESRVKHL